MGQEFRYWCPMETRRLLWLVGVMFVVIMIFQLLEVPAGNILSFISSVHNDQIAENGNLLRDDALSKSDMVSNMTLLNDLNSTYADDVHERAGKYGKEKDAGVNYDFESEASVVSNHSSGIDSHDKESSLHQVLQPNGTLNPINNFGEISVSDETGHRFSRENMSLPLENTRTSDANNDLVSEASIGMNPEIDNHDDDDEDNDDDENDSSLQPSIHSAVDTASNPDSMSNSDNHGKSGKLQNNIAKLNENSPVTTNFELKKMPKLPISGVISVSEMNSLLLQSWSSSSLMRSRRNSAVDQELLHAKSLIENAPIVENDAVLYTPLYWNFSKFKRSYELMENMLKVYIYKEGEKPILHQPVLKGIYASEGWFMKHLEASKKFVTKKPRKAHLFYLPFSSRNLELELYVPNSHNHKGLVEYLKNYLDMIVAKYPFWNRTEGMDHFLAACHDWAPSETRKVMSNCIRALCNADVREGFVFGKDVSLPETNVRMPQNPLRDLGGRPPSQRSILAFFAGSMHGYLRPILLKHWANKDPDMKILGRMPKAKRKMNYVQHMKSSKYCICARGFEVNSPRIVEAIMYECVPVIISDNYVPPFFEVLNWESFAVFILEKDIPNLKNILLSIPEKRFRQMQMRVKKVQQHFLWHARPVKYDLFHMILHSVWYNRVMQQR
ncbi:probable glycosyltransferase At3g07620 isoform X2 [Jatropha curcas]|uniref:probable glycosyltransferase At3g07620 isoform X2 n=1 Tax=Jatropha curcas TaxID=180498 RepID=UPI0005FAC562|nr:probable glycosyltransferase At3g07620 isoform X2 [Jatropha curcas]